MKSEMWAKYKFGDFYKINDGATNSPAVRNPFTQAKAGDLPIPGMGVDELLAKGVLVGVCNIALTIYSGMFAKKMAMQAEAIKKEWVANLLPGVLVVPSGVIAVNRTRSEEHTSELQSRSDLVCRLLLEKKKKMKEKTRIID